MSIIEVILSAINAIINFLLSLIGIKPVPPTPVPTPPTPPTPTPPTPPTPTGGPAPLPTGRHLIVINQSNQVSAADVAAYIAAQQIQINRDFSIAWGGSCTIDEGAAGGPAGWPVYLMDNTDVAGALGYHDIDAQGVPYAKVFVATSQAALVPWQSVASHEVLEMLADANTTTQDAGADGCLWYQEVGDPVEDQSYVINGVIVSDFVLPSWFTIGGKAPFDKNGVLAAPFTVTSGGYATEVCQGQTVTVGGAAARSVDRTHQRK